MLRSDGNEVESQIAMLMLHNQLKYCSIHKLIAQNIKANIQNDQYR